MPSNIRTRRRKLAGPRSNGKGVWSLTTGQTITSSAHNGRMLEGRQVTVSEGHQWPPPVKGKLIDRGGPFLTTRSFFAKPRTLPYTKLQKTTSNNVETFTGLLCPALSALVSPGDPSTLLPPSLESSDSALDAKGAKAVALCKPTSPQVDLGTALAELFREGLPGVPLINALKEATSLIYKTGSEFLNYIFGVKPTVDAVQDTVKALKRADSVIEQYMRDAGKVVRRSFYFSPEITETDTQVYSNSYPYGLEVLPNIRPGYQGKCVLHRKIERKFWFKGAFTYFLPLGLTDGWKGSEFSEKADILLGTDLTPETLWNIGPWSWLTDWALNTGDIISNIMDFGSGELVMRYGYIMETTTVTDTYTHYPAGPFSGPAASVTPLTFVTITKKRRPANPFGFGVTYDGLSPLQAAILAALGVTRGSK